MQRLQKLALGCLASFAIYSYGMGLNDLADLPENRRQGRARPLVEGTLGLRMAILLTMSLLLLATGVGFALPGEGPLLLLVLGIAATLYNTIGKRSPFAGPVLLGLCRALNLTLGASLAAPLFETSHDLLFWLPIGLTYAVYVGSLSGLARMEDEDRLTLFKCRAFLFLAALGFSGPAVLLAFQSHWHPLGLMLSLLGTIVILHASRDDGSPWTRKKVGKMVGFLLRLIVVYDAAIIASLGSLEVAAMVLLLYPVCRTLARFIPPT